MSGPDLDAAAVRRVWDEVAALFRREITGAAERAAVAAESDVTVMTVRGHTVTIIARDHASAGALMWAAGDLEAALREVLGGEWRVDTLCRVESPRR